MPGWWSAPGARSRCQSHTRHSLSGRQHWPGQSRHRTADPITPETLRSWPQVCLRSSANARKGATRGVPPLPILPIPAGPVRQAGGCIQPVLLRGRVDHIDGATGELLHRYSTVHEPGGVLPVACKTRRASRCPPCAEVYSADTYQLIRAGLSGGKGVPDTVASHPCVFTTLTAPSFGPVHLPRARKTAGSCAAARAGAARPARMASTHVLPVTGTARDDDRCSASRCARTATTTPARSCSTPAPPNCGGASPSPCAGPSPARPGSPTRRLLPRSGSPSPRSPNTSAAAWSTSTPSSASTAPAGPTTAPPAWATLDLLTAAIAQAADAVHLDTPGRARPARPHACAGAANTTPGLSPPPGNSPTPGSPPTSPSTPPRPPNAPAPSTAASPPPTSSPNCPSASTPAASSPTCLRLGKLPALEDLRLAAWAHMLGFRGHFSTKSRALLHHASARCAPNAPSTSATTAPPRASGRHPTTTPRSSSPTGDFAGQAYPSTTALSADAIRSGAPPTQPARGRPAMTRLLLTVPEAAEALAISPSRSTSC